MNEKYGSVSLGNSIMAGNSPTAQLWGGDFMAAQKYNSSPEGIRSSDTTPGSWANSNASMQAALGNTTSTTTSDSGGMLGGGPGGGTSW